MQLATIYVLQNGIGEGVSFGTIYILHYILVDESRDCRRAGEETMRSRQSAFIFFESYVYTYTRTRERTQLDRSWPTRYIEPGRRKFSPWIVTLMIYGQVFAENPNYMYRPVMTSTSTTCADHRRVYAAVNPWGPRRQKTAEPLL